MRGRLRPSATMRVADRMKLHKHLVRLAGGTYTVLCLRPGMDARFSTNRYHDTWHILSDLHGARLLGRLLWGLAYQRVPGTLVLIDRPFLDPNPFDAAPADPIALVPARLTPLHHEAAHQIRRRLPHSVPHATIRWHTFGLTAAVAAHRDRAANGWRTPGVWPRAVQHRVHRMGGWLLLAGTPSALRDWAVGVYQLGDFLYHGMDYTELDWPHGEVQVFTDYRHRVSEAQTARREVLAALPQPLLPADLEPLIWKRTAAAHHRRRSAPCQ